jgi:hypothetical protein
MRPRLIILALLGATACDLFDTKQAPPAPQTENVCEHVVRIAAKSGEGDAKVIESGCAAALERVRKHYDTLSACLLNTNTMEEIRACEQPMRTWTSVVAYAETGPSPAKVCEHVMGIMKRELGEALPMSDDDVKNFSEECEKEMVSERAEMGEFEFAKQAGCVIEARTLADMEKCDKKQSRK